MVNNDILLQKCTIYRLSDSAIEWFKSYLSDRSQMVQYQQTISEPMIVTSRVPQGSIWGPLVFILLHNIVICCYCYMLDFNTRWQHISVHVKYNKQSVIPTHNSMGLDLPHRDCFKRILTKKVFDTPNQILFW